MTTASREQIIKTIRALSARGFTVLPPAEKSQARTRIGKETIQMQILRAFEVRSRLGKNLGLGRDGQGYTDQEVSELLGHPDLHARCSELRACGLISPVVQGNLVSRRKANGRVGTVSRITRAGLAVLQAEQGE